MSGRIVHFEVPFDDGDRARAFYGDLFGWKLQHMPDMQYTLVMTGPVSEQGVSSEPGYINGGMMQREARQHPCSSSTSTTSTPPSQRWASGAARWSSRSSP